MIVLPDVTKPANSSVEPTVVSNLRDLTTGFLGAALANGMNMREEITTNESKRLTLIPASDRARLS